MKKICSLLVACFFVSAVNAICCDDRDPICVTSILVEKAIMLKNAETKKYRCKQDEEMFDIVLLADKLALDSFKEKGVDFQKQAWFDFDGIKYEVLDIDGLTAKVKVSGESSIGFTGTDFSHKSEFEAIYDLKKEGESWVFCPDKL